MLLVADGIYHYTLHATTGIPLEQARPTAIQAGRDFIEAHEEYVKPHREQCTFTWHSAADVMKTAPYLSYKDDFQQIYEQDEGYHTLVDEFADKYLERLLNRQDAISDEEVAFKQQCVRRYLLEECAIMASLGDEGWGVMVYPGAVKAFEDICEGRHPCVPNALSGLVFVALRLSRGGLYFGDGAAKANAGSTTTAGHGVLADFDQDDWQQFLKYTRRKSCRAGDVLMSARDQERNLYILLSGTLEVLVGDWKNDATLRQVATRGPGSVLGEQSFVDGQPRSATVAALDDCELLTLAPKQFKKMRAKHPEMAATLLFDISRVLSLRYRWKMKEPGAVQPW